VRQRVSRHATLSLAALAVCAGLALAQGETPPAPQPTAPPPASPPSPDQAGPVITIELTSGEVMKGVVKSVSADAVVIVHQVLGDVKIPRVGIKSSDPPIDKVPAPPPPPPPVPQAAATPAPQPAPAPAPAPPPAPPKPDVKGEAKLELKPAKEKTPPKNPIEAIFADDEKSFLVGWKRNVELGFNGSNGPNDSQNFRAYVNLSRGTKKMATNANASYIYGENNNGKTQDRGEFNIRNDWNLGGTPWSFWASGRSEFDAQQDWDARVHAATGVGYVIKKTEKLSLVGRVGVGGYREINGENALIPEVGVASLSLDYKLSDKTSTYAHTEFYPSGRNWDWDEFRATSRAGLQWVIDPKLQATLRLGVEHRHDSVAPGDRANVFDYFLVLGFSF